MAKENDILQSLNGAKRADPSPYLFTRIRARMERDESTVGWLAQTIGFITKPAFITACLLMLLLGNVALLALKNNAASKSEKTEEIVWMDPTYNYENLYK